MLVSGFLAISSRLFRSKELRAQEFFFKLILRYEIRLKLQERCDLFLVYEPGARRSSLTSAIASQVHQIFKSLEIGGLAAAMEEDKKISELWFQNEERIAAALKQLEPLFKTREELEEKLPELRALRIRRAREEKAKKAQKPAEPAKPAQARPEEPAKKSTILKDSGMPLPGQPDRPVPTEDQARKILDKRRQDNQRRRNARKKMRTIAKQVVGKGQEEKDEEKEEDSMQDLLPESEEEF